MFFTDIDEEAFTLLRHHVEGRQDVSDGDVRLPDRPPCATCFPLLIWTPSDGEEVDPSVPRVGFITPGLCPEGRALAGRCIAAEPEPGKWAAIPMLPWGAVGPFVELDADAEDWTTLHTPDLPYAAVRLHGIRIRMPPGAVVIVSGLAIKGSTNLFWHEGPGDARAYLAGVTRPALRNTPAIISPNTAYMDVRACGPDGASVSVVVEALLEPLEESPYAAVMYGTLGVDVPSPAFLRKLGQLEKAIAGLFGDDEPATPERPN